MAYTSQDDLEIEFGEDVLIQLTDRTQSGAIDSVRVAQAVADTEELIASIAPGRTLPASRQARHIAFYFLHSFGAPEDVTARYQQAVAELKAMAAGSMAGGETDGVAVQFAESDRVFSVEH